MFFKSYWLLGQNARNLLYIKWHNTKIAKKLADSKLKTKEFLKANNIATPETYFVLSSHEEINDSIFEKLNPPFVVKPNGGFGGKWILVIDKTDASWNYITNSWKVYSKEALKKHFLEIIDWFYSLSWNRDKAIIEKKIELDEEIELLGKYWLPDIRVIVFNMVPVMAMLRVPTKESKWKANLHAWACWVGIDIWTWKLTFITYKWKTIKSIPGIWDVRWLKIPHWEKILELSVKTQQVTKIGYIGCDIVIDKEDWPLVLEVNIRPWLEVQLANMAPLKDRLKKVEWIFVNSVEKWVRLWRDLFSWDIEEKIKNISWKKVVWAREYLHLIYNDKEYKFLANIKPSNTKSYIDKKFAIEVLKLEEKNIEKWYIKLKTKLLWEEKNTKFILKDLWSVNILLWLNALKWFLIDPFKYKKWELPIWEEFEKSWKNIALKKNYEKIIANIDKELNEIDKKLLILKYTSPINLWEEKQKFIQSNWEYIPQLEYKEINLNLDELETKLNKIEITEIPLASIFKRKKDEIKIKIDLLKAIKEQNIKDISYFSKKLYWDISKENLEYSKNILKQKTEIKEETELLDFEEIKNFIKKFNHIYDINITLKIAEKNTRFVMKWDVLYIRKWIKIWKRELRSVIAHEIEWHYLRKINWKKQNYEIFSRWTWFYLEIDEGIAILNQNRFLTKTDRKYYWIFERYYFIDYASKHSYEDLIKELKRFYNNDLEKVFRFLIRLKRWIKNVKEEWIFYKDSVYVNWFLKVEEFLNNSWSLEELYIWKISILDLIEIKNSYFIDFNFNQIITPFFVKV